MSNDAPTSLVRLSTPVVMIFPNVVTAVHFKNKGKTTSTEPSFSASFVLPSDNPDLSVLKAAILAVCKDKWPSRDIGAAVKADHIKIPLAFGNSMITKRQEDLQVVGKEYKGENDFLKGAVVLKTGTKKFPPALGYWDATGQKWIDLDENTKKAHESRFYFGAEALIEVNLSAYNKVNSDAKDGVKAYLQKVYVTGKGKRLVGGTPGSEVFKGYAGSVSMEDPTQGLGDDEISF